MDPLWTPMDPFTDPQWTQVDVNKRMNGDTCLITAAYEGHLDVVELLLKARGTTTTNYYYYYYFYYYYYYYYYY
jgi:hypothetical protein